MPYNSVVQKWRAGRDRLFLPMIADAAPVDLRIVGRTLFHAALVGLASGLAGAAYFGALEYLQRFLLEDLAGYVPLLAHGETFAASEGPHTFRPWLLVLFPMLGGLACGLLTQLFAVEVLYRDGFESDALVPSCSLRRSPSRGSSAARSEGQPFCFWTIRGSIPVRLLSSGWASTEASRTFL